MKYLQELGEEPNNFQRRINHLIEVQENRKKVSEQSQRFQENIKKVFEKNNKEDGIQDKVVKWDACVEDKGKHRRFDNIWKGRYQIVVFRSKNSFIMQYLKESYCLEFQLKNSF